MTSNSEFHPHGKANFAENPFEQLPRDLLLPMVKLTSDLATLWSLSRVSRAVHFLIDDCGKEIVETVLRASEPKEICVLIGPIALLKLGMHPSTSLHEFRTRHVGTWIQIRRVLIDNPSLGGLSLPDSQRIAENSYGLLPNGVPPMVIHTILRTAYKINRLTHLCHKHFTDRCKSLVVSEPIQLNTSGPIDLKHSECRKYSVRDIDPPSWIEEKRITRAFWYIQLFYELKSNAKKLHWTKSDLDRLRIIDVGGFYIMRKKSCPVGNSIRTVALYLSEASEGLIVNTTQNTIPTIQLPHPAENVSVTVPAEPKFESEELDGWGQGADRIDHYLSSLPGIWVPFHLVRVFCRTKIPYSRFRRLGFAIWDRKRMFALGLANSPGQNESTGTNGRELVFKYLTLSE